LRTDLGAFRRVRLDDPLVIQLREVGRVDEDLAHEMSRLVNRLRDQLHRVMPELLRLAPAADEPWLWSLLARAATPTVMAMARLHRGTVEDVLRQHRIRRVTTGEVTAALKAPQLAVAPGVAEAAAAHVRTLLPRLRLTREQRNECARAMDKLLHELAAPLPDAEKPEHRDAAILQSLPGVGRIVAATVLAEASSALAERDYHSLRSQVGVAPVTRQSGKKRLVVMRRACSGRLREALYHWARVATTIDPPSRAFYDKARSRGKTHGHALRVLGDRLLRILISMLNSRTLYDPGRSGADPTAEATC
jgi:transposase